MTDEGTAYVVFARTDRVENDVWFVIGELTAARKEDAVATVVAGYEGDRPLDGARFRAVPASTWKDEFEAEQTVRVRRVQ